MRIEISPGISIEVSDEKIKELILREVSDLELKEVITEREIKPKKRVGRPKKKQDLRGLKLGRDYKYCMNCGKIIYKDTSSPKKMMKWSTKKFCKITCKSKYHAKKRYEEIGKTERKEYVKKEKVGKKGLVSKIWTAGKTKLLKKHKQMKRSQLAEILGVTPRQVTDKFVALGIKKRE